MKRNSLSHDLLVPWQPIHNAASECICISMWYLEHLKPLGSHEVKLILEMLTWALISFATKAIPITKIYFQTSCYWRTINKFRLFLVRYCYLQLHAFLTDTDNSNNTNDVHKRVGRKMWAIALEKHNLG